MQRASEQIVPVKQEFAREIADRKAGAEVRYSRQSLGESLPRELAGFGIDRIMCTSHRLLGLAS